MAGPKAVTKGKVSVVISGQDRGLGTERSGVRPNTIKELG